MDSKQSAQKLKVELRKRYRAEREFLVVESNWEHLLASIELIEAKVVASYVSYGFEPDTSKLNQKLIEMGKFLVIPKMLPDKNLLWITLQDQIYEGEIDVFIMPALHVDQNGNRLGQGGGSYDRALVNSNGWRVALIYPGELSSEDIPSEPHDQRLDAAATAEILVRFTARS